MRQLIIFLFAFLLYSGTFNYPYLLDDHDVIDNNSITQKGFSGLPEIFATPYRADLNYSGDELYRPLSKALFAIEWGIWPDNPSAAHIINVLLFALLCCLIYSVLYKYLGEPLVPFIVAMLFASHPIHTEVVANIKSADEILALIFSLLSLYFIHGYFEKQKSHFLFFSIGSFFLALLSKESAVVFIAIIPLTVYFFTGQTVRKNIILTAYHLIPLIVFLVIRNRIVGDLPPQSEGSPNFLTQIDGFLNQKATAIMLLGYYLLILFFPVKLMIDGSFNQFPAVTITDWQFFLQFIIYAALIIFAIKRFRRNDQVSFSILFFFISVSVVSNIFILIGTNYGERLMFTPSLGICLLFATFITQIFSKRNETQNFFQSYKNPILASLILVLPFSWKTINRSAEWKDELTLYSVDAASAPNSARAQYYLGNQYALLMPGVTDQSASEEYAAKGIEKLRKAIQILPSFDESYYSMGQIYMNLDIPDSALKYYRIASELTPENPRFQNNYGDVLFKLDRYREAKEHFALAVKYDSLYADALTNLGTGYSRIGQEWLESAQRAQQQKDDNLLKTNYEISMLYYDSAVVYLRKSIELNPDFYLPYYILGIVYRNKNEIDKSNYFYSKAQELK